MSSRLPPFFQNHCRGQTGTYASSALVESCESRLCNYSRFDRHPLCTGPFEDRGGRTAIQYLMLHVPWRQPGELRSGFRSAPPHSRRPFPIWEFSACGQESDATMEGRARRRADRSALAIHSGEHQPEISRHEPPARYLQRAPSDVHGNQRGACCRHIDGDIAQC